MTQIALVKRKISWQRVEVTVQRQSACGHHCESCQGCSMSQSPQVTVVADDPLGVEPGQRVQLESATGRVLGLAALLYIVPFIALFAGYFLLENQSEVIAALGGIAAFFMVLLGLCLPVDRHLRRNQTVTFRVIAVEES